MIVTIGHGSRAIGEFIGLLGDAEIRCLVDVRAYPASHRHPQFAREALERSLADAGIRYVWEGKALGGRRKPAGNSAHVALRHSAFRAYADHMGSDEFRQRVERLTELGRAQRAAVMCAERLPWQCHRFLISDFLVAGGVGVAHIINTEAAREHRLNVVARLRDGRLFYDGKTQAELKLEG